MGKKSESAPAASAAVETPLTINPVPETPTTNGATNGAAKKAAAPKKKPAAKSSAKSTTKAAPKKVQPVSISTEDIALRAYFISEHRQRMGLPGDSHSDWIQAERELKADRKKAARKPATRKKAV